MPRPSILTAGLSLLLLGATLPLVAQGDTRPPRPGRPPERPSRDAKPADPYRDPEPLKPADPYPQSGDRERREDRRDERRDDRRDDRREDRRESGSRPYPMGPPPHRDARPPYAPSPEGSTNLGPDRSQGGRYAPPSRSREQARAWERSRGWQAEGAWGQRRTWRDHRARQWEAEHRTWSQRGGYGGYFIPAPEFHRHFGPDRWFRIRSRPAIHLGYPRFQYGGYWFQILDPWPEFWSETWYADDEVYIDYDDGYYLHNRRHPGISIAISVSF